ncbi:hypothetical protein Lal_00013866, partial [Lupinus albus]
GSEAVADSRFVVRYFRKSRDGRLLFGGREAYTADSPRDISRHIRKQIAEIYPELKDIEITHAWGGSVGITMPRKPFVREVMPGVTSIAGYSGHGVMLSNYAGKMYADSIVGNTSELDLFKELKIPPFPGGARLRSPLLFLALTWHEQPNHPVEPFDYVVFGGTGDLAERKLLPALYHRQIEGQFSEPTRIIGASRSALSHEDFRKFANDALKEHLKSGEYDEAEVAKFLARLFYVSVDAKSDGGWDQLKKLLDDGKDRVRAFYLAVSPAIFGAISEKIRDHKLITKSTRIVVEKPIGRNLASALELNDTIGKVFKEEQIFRIDHYLGKETVQNLMALRFANALYEPLWNAQYIDHVQISVAESVGLEGRAGYYDTAGALRDMVQNHILQLLCLVAMEVPSSMDSEAVRDEKLKVLRALKPITSDNVEQMTVRGQYRAGASAGGPVKGYLESWKAAFPTRKPSLPSKPRSTTGAGRVCPSTSARASGWRAACRRSSSPSSRSRTTFSMPLPVASWPTS